jgi:hypothetical protein
MAGKAVAVIGEVAPIPAKDFLRNLGVPPNYRPSFHIHQ